MESKEKTAKCPPELKLFIDAANLVPTKFIFDKKFEFIMDNLSIESVDLVQNNGDEEGAVKLYYEIIRNLPQSFFKESFDLPKFQNIHPYKVFNLLEELHSFWAESLRAKKILILLVLLNRSDQFTNVRQRLGFAFEEVEDIKLTVSEGLVRFKMHRIFEILQERQIDTRRIMRCRFCQRIVWREQIDAYTCGEGKETNPFDCPQKRKDLNRRTSTKLTKKMRELNEADTRWILEIQSWRSLNLTGFRNERGLFLEEVWESQEIVRRNNFAKELQKSMNNIFTLLDTKNKKKQEDN